MQFLALLLLLLRYHGIRVDNGQRRRAPASQPAGPRDRRKSSIAILFLPHRTLCLIVHLISLSLDNPVLSFFACILSRCAAVRRSSSEGIMMRCVIQPLYYYITPFLFSCCCSCPSSEADICFCISKSLVQPTLTWSSSQGCWWFPEGIL